MTITTHFISSGKLDCMLLAYITIEAVYQLTVERKFENPPMPSPINPFVPNAPFFYTLKTSENCEVF